MDGSMVYMYMYKKRFVNFIYFIPLVTPMSCDLQSCSQHITCGDCNNENGCFWCQSLNKCIDENVYPYSFLYGQCFVWSKTCPGMHLSHDPHMIVTLCLCYYSWRLF